MDVPHRGPEAGVTAARISLRSRVLGGLQAAGLGTAVVAALKLVQLVVLARMLAPDSFGVMGMAAIVMGLLAHVAEIGAGSVVVRRQSLSARELNTLFWIGLGIGASAMALVHLASGPIARHFNEPRLVAVFGVLSFTLIINPIGLPYRSMLERDLNFRAIAGAEAMGALVGVGVAIFLAFLGIGLMSLAWGLLSTSITNAALFILAGGSEWRPRLALSAESLAPNFSFGAHLSGQRLFNFATANADYFFIGTFMGSQALGYYSVAYMLANLPSSHINALLGRVSYPALARMQDDLGRMKAAYLKFQEVSGVVNAPLLFGLAVAADIAIPGILGPAWAPAAPILQVLCLVGLGRAISGTIGPLLLARGRPDLGFRWSVLVIALQVPLLYVGLRAAGTMGVAIGFAVAQTIIVVLNYQVLVKTLLGPCLREYLHAVTASLLPAALMGTCMWAVGAALSPGWSTIPVLVVQIGAGVAIYLAALRQLRHHLWLEVLETFRRRVAR